MRTLSMVRDSLRQLTFAKVIHVASSKENLLSFEDENGTVFANDACAKIRWEMIPTNQRWAANPRFSYYYGFAQIEGEDDVHFTSRDCLEADASLLDLGLKHADYRLKPIPKCSWVVGHKDTKPRDHKPYFLSWQPCTEAEKLFAEFLIQGVRKFSNDDVQRLHLDELTEHKDPDRLCIMAKIFLEGDLEYFTAYRRLHGKTIDARVHNLCFEWGQMQTWMTYHRYVVLADTRRPNRSAHIPKPIPKPNMQQTALIESSIALNMPIQTLALA